MIGAAIFLGAKPAKPTKPSPPQKIIKSDVVQAKAFWLVDDDGKSRGMIKCDESGAYLSLFDSHENVLVQLKCQENGRSLLNLGSIGGGKGCIEMTCFPDGAGVIALNAKGNPVLEFRRNSTSATFSMLGGDGESGISAESMPDGRSIITMIDKDSKPQIVAKVDDQGTELSVRGAGDGEAVEIFGDTRGVVVAVGDGKSMATIAHRTKDGKASIAIREEGKVTWVNP